MGPLSVRDTEGGEAWTERRNGVPTPMTSASRAAEIRGRIEDRKALVGVIGLGYVGLPVALDLAKQFEPVIGFDISRRRIAALQMLKT